MNSNIRQRFGQNEDTQVLRADAELELPRTGGAGGDGELYALPGRGWADDKAGSCTK
ncbi:MAG: hypothetical protein ACOC7K_02535 [bacterium]